MKWVHQSMDEEDMTALKCCLVSLGALLGMGVSSKYKKPVGFAAATLFAGLAIPLASRVKELRSKTEETEE